jgi:hypothetical protein
MNTAGGSNPLFMSHEHLTMALQSWRLSGASPIEDRSSGTVFTLDLRVKVVGYVPVRYNKGPPA